MTFRASALGKVQRQHALPIQFGLLVKEIKVSDFGTPFHFIWPELPSCGPPPCTNVTAQIRIRGGMRESVDSERTQVRVERVRDERNYAM